MKDSEFSTTAEKVFYMVSLVFMSTLVIALLGLLIFLEFYISKPAFTLIWIPLFPILGLICNRLSEHFIGGKIYGANWITDARKGKGLVKQTKRRTRKVLTTFIECTLFVLLIARFIVFLSTNKIFSIIGISFSAIGFVSYFIIGVIPTE